MTNFLASEGVPFSTQVAPPWRCLFSYREHSVILTSHRGLLYNPQESITSSCHTRRHPWELLKLSRSRRSVQENNGTLCASSSMHALTTGSIPSNSSGPSHRQLSWRSPLRCGTCASKSPADLRRRT